MFVKHFILLVYTSTVLIPSYVEGCTVLTTGWTFPFNEEEDLLKPGVDSLESCEQECKQLSDCQAYTLELIQPIPLCIAFKNISSTMIQCNDCTTVSITGIVANSSCPTDPEDQIAEVKVNSTTECLVECTLKEECKHFLYFNENSVLPRTCFLYSSECEGSTPCYNCESGVPHCLNLPFTADECYPENHYILDDPTRNTEHGGESYCDNSQKHTSPDWQGGQQWYRMKMPAGEVIPEQSPGQFHCGTAAPAWIQGSHPQEIDETYELAACFDYDGNQCAWQVIVQITNCGQYYVYRLPEVPFCWLRYCAAQSL